MSWKQINVVEERMRFVRGAFGKMQTFGAHCRSFGISRKTGYKWMARFEARGRAGLADGSRAPHRAARRCAPRWKERVLSLRRLHPRWGARKLRAVLLRCHRRAAVPALRTITQWVAEAGLTVPRTRRARPGDNAAHEQFHRVLKAETASPPAATVRQQQKRIERWVRHYNEERPHEALGQRPPARLYRSGRRAMPAALPEPAYPKTCSRRRVRPHGDIKWQGRLRFIGRAFTGQWIGLQALAPGVWKVRLARLSIGELHAQDPAGMRPAHLTTRP